MAGFKEPGHPVDGLVVDEDCAEQRLLGFQVVGRVANQRGVGGGVVGLGGERSGEFC